MDVLATLRTLFDLALVILGFGLIIFIHELGHFLAARWAGIRVLAFAVGFGPALLSYRKGMGLRRGSSDREYAAMRVAAGQDTARESRATQQDTARESRATTVSPTEYRLNALPFGGYVKMLGQDDLAPAVTSAESDSYQGAPIWKRMIVISAGVVLNAVTAAILFVIVFMIGIESQPPVVGGAVPGMAASRAVAVNAGALGVEEAGLKAGDRVVELNGSTPRTFSDLVLASAMARRGRTVALTVERDGVPAPLEFHIQPEPGPFSKLLELGIEVPRSPRLFDVPRRQREEWDQTVARLGLAGVEPGMRLVRAGGKPVERAADLTAAVRDSGGRPVELVFESDDGRRVSGEIEPRPELEADLLPGRGPDTVRIHNHLLGLTPVMTVEMPSPEGARKGLEAGDIFARLGEVEFPSLPQGIDEIRRHRGREIAVTVLRSAEGGGWTEVDLSPSVSGAGTIGFAPGFADQTTLLAMPPRSLAPLEANPEPYEPAAVAIARPGVRLTSVAGTPVQSFAEIREALRAATRSAFERGEAAAGVSLVVERWGPGGAPASGAGEEVEWRLSRRDLERLHRLGWQSPLGLGFFEPEEFLLRSEGPLGAIGMGLHETGRVMMQTYLTFARLFEGTVKVEHLKGPVGIAHLGTLLAERGFIWLLFFMALVSVNLAVINFLPLPIVDGGQFVFLLVEQATGRPVPAGVQNAATFAGLLLIGAIFLIVTFNDIRALIGG